MATTSIWKIVKRLDHVIEYAENENKTKGKGMEYKDLKQVIDYAETDFKTEDKKYVIGLNCDPRTAYQEMMTTKKHFRKEKGIIAFHAEQSFAEGEITPDLAHKIGVELANELWGDRFEVVITTHLNTKHIHNHFVINSVSFKDGKKFYDNNESYAYMRHISDELCKKYRLNVLEEKPTKKTNINYENFYKKRMSRTYKTYEEMTKEDLDYAILQSYNYNDFLKILNAMGYTITTRAEKLSLLHPPYKRNIRIERRYGEEYSIKNIIKRIDETENEIKVPFPEANSKFKSNYNHTYKIIGKKPKVKKGNIRKIYLYYIYLIKSYERNPIRKNYSPSIRADLKRKHQIVQENSFLIMNNIYTYKDLMNFSNDIKLQISNLEGLITNYREQLSKIDKDKIDNINEIRNKLESFTDYRNILKRKELMLEEIKDDLPMIKENITEEIENEKTNEKQKEKSKNIEEK